MSDTPYNVSGWVKRPPDPRDYPMSMHLATVTTPRPKAKLWQEGPNLDQGQTPHCVGFCGADWMGAEPIMDAVTNQTGDELYAACKQVDGSPNTDGSYDRALMKVLQSQGRVASYHWAANEPEIMDWVLTTGPVMLGTVWHQKMFTPNAKDRISPTGPIAGGHEYLITGYASGCYRIRNSWGALWGANGDAYLSRASVKRLVFVEGGDACAAIEKTPLAPAA